MSTVSVVQNWRKRTKEKCVSLLGGKCARCGYAKCLRALQFHHRNRDDKSFAIFNALNNPKKWETIEAELSKCDLLCANCHAEVEEAYDQGLLSCTC